MKKEVLNYAVAVVLSLALGGLAGWRMAGKRSAVSEEVKYVRGETFVADIELPATRVELLPERLRFADTEIPADAVFPDSVDLRPTAYDWNISRQYPETLFDDLRGKLTVDATVQYNRLQGLNVEFVPVEKQIIRYIEKKWRPFAVLDYSMLGYVGGGVGIFYKSTGISIQYRTDFKRKGLGVSLMRIF